MIDLTNINANINNNQNVHQFDELKDLLRTEQDLQNTYLKLENADYLISLYWKLVIICFKTFIYGYIVYGLIHLQEILRYFKY
jgi:hypothetical protein